jgi:arabinan endo-1,5-alpha-L-arabinosidase
MFLFQVAMMQSPVVEPPLQGDVRAHDPSRIVKTDDGYYVYFTTGPLMPMHVSKDLIHWDPHPGIMKEIPAWAKEHVPKGNTWIWAPDLFYDKELRKWVILYSYSTFGSRRSSIGAITSPDFKLDSTWTDAGEVQSSVETDNFNAIDPCPVFDDHGHLYMSFGSWNTGIKIEPIDLKTLKPVGAMTGIAGADRTDMEASFIWRKGRYYYLFYNQGLCCRGVNSTYHIMVGRATSITGPYLDKNGVDCYMKGGGTIFMETNGNRIGPGQAGVSENGKLFSFHFYNKDLNGQPNFTYGKLGIDKEGWPAVTEIH